MYNLHHFLQLVICLYYLLQASSFRQYPNKKNSYNLSTNKYAVLEGTAASLLSGAFAGSIGVGASYPLDSIKTKSQALASSRTKNEKSPGMFKMFSIIYQTEGDGYNTQLCSINRLKFQIITSIVSSISS